MNKSEFVRSLKEFKEGLEQLQADCDAAPGKQVRRVGLLDRMEKVAALWFETYEPKLRWDFKFDEHVLDRFRLPFGRLLEITDGSPSKKVAGDLIREALAGFHPDLIVPVQKHHMYYQEHPVFGKLLDAAREYEKDYLLEAIECARAGKPRAAIVLGWSAAVNRLHLYIAHARINKFNQASAQMQAIKTGRYKRFTKKFFIQNLADLRMSVFDTDLLWVLEFMGVIDGNQHERLEICLTMRNTAAHPGEAPFSDENVASFFSDLHPLVFENPNLPIDLVERPGR